MSNMIADMADTIHGSVGLDIAGFPFVGGYVSGTPDIQWTAGDWSLFGKARKIRIWQNPGAAPAIDGYDVLDVENGAVTPAEAAQEIRSRVQAGVTWTTVYGTDATLQGVAQEVQKLGKNIWIGHVNCWLADWNLNRAEAILKVGSMVHGMTCVAVQWASPTSNPNTVLGHGSTKTLREANVDLSVVDLGWTPDGAIPPPVKPPVPPAGAHVVSVVAKYSDGSEHVLLQL